MQQVGTVLLLSIDFRGKPVPYPPEDHGTSVNHGFKCLKGKPELIADISEAQDNDNLRNALAVLNSKDTGFFTVGCEKSFNKVDAGTVEKPYWAKGFLEISFNAKELVSDARHYFVLFFQFNEYVKQCRFAEDVLYEWELVGATFKDAACSGWTACTWVTTGYLATEAESREVWGKAIDFLVEFLRNVSVQSREQIY
jgi:hypothetical protein